MIYDYFYELASEALHIVIFENFIKPMMSCLSKLKVTHSFCFAFKIPDDVTASNNYVHGILETPIKAELLNHTQFSSLEIFINNKEVGNRKN